MSECMTQEDAERMDASQAVQILKPLRAMMLDQWGCPISDVYFALGKAIEALEQPTVDAVPVVRCEQCKWCEYPAHNSTGYACKLFDRCVKWDWFCADGKRKEQSDG